MLQRKRRIASLLSYAICPTLIGNVSDMSSVLPDIYSYCCPADVPAQSLVRVLPIPLMLRMHYYCPRIHNSPRHEVAAGHLYSPTK